MEPVDGAQCPRNVTAGLLIDQEACVHARALEGGQAEGGQAVPIALLSLDGLSNERHTMKVRSRNTLRVESRRVLAGSSYPDGSTGNGSEGRASSGTVGFDAASVAGSAARHTTARGAYVRASDQHAAFRGEQHATHHGDRLHGAFARRAPVESTQGLSWASLQVRLARVVRVVAFALMGLLAAAFAGVVVFVGVILSILVGGRVLLGKPPTVRRS